MMATHSSNSSRFIASSSLLRFHGPVERTPRTARVVLEPARLVAAHEGDVEPPAEQMIERGRVLGHAQRIVRGQHVAELVDAQPRPMLPQEHRHQPRVLAELEALDLQVMLRDADARPPGGIADARVPGDVIEHPGANTGIAT